MTKSELDVYLKILPDYLKHLSSGKLSLLAPILGAFTLDTPHVGKLHFMVMENTLKLRNFK